MFTKQSMRRGARSTFLALFAALPAGVCSAGDHYVDAVNGNNANSGTSPTNAWRTISFAVATLAGVPPFSAETIHVAPGTYDAPLGEQFPINMRPALRLVGESGSAATVIDGQSTGASLLLFSSLSFPNGYEFEATTLLQGFTIRRGGRGIVMTSDRDLMSPTLRDLAVREMSGAGIVLALQSNASAPLAEPVMDHLRVTQNALGFDCGADTFPGGPTVRPAVSDCEFSNNTSHGVSVSAVGQVIVRPQLRRCRIERNGGDGVRASYGHLGNEIVLLEDCSISANSGDGVEGVFADTLASLTLTLRRCTIADNASAGLNMAAGTYAPFFMTASLDACVLYGNGDDVLQTGTTTARYCDVGDGDFTGVYGNISADPLFVAAASGDYRLSYGSPCAETANAMTPAGGLDLLGVARPLDGDLNRVLAPDMGAFELAPLVLKGTLQVGQPFALEVFGPPNGATRVYQTFAPLISPPKVTVNGLRYLRRTAMTLTGIFVTAPGGASIPLSIANNPALAGQTLSFQALTQRTSGGTVYTWSNPVTAVILP